MIFRIVFCAFCLLYTTSLFAGNIVLEADKRVEYHQKGKKIVALGKAVLTKDNLSIKAETLIGYYNPNAKNKISKMEAFKDIVVKTPNGVLTADGSFTYYEKESKAIATDNAVATDTKGNKVSADKMTAYFTKDKQGNFVLKNIEMEKNIKINSQNAVVTADNGTYNASEGKIILTNNIVINQNGNILKGEKAETNLNTGISRILSGEKSGRVSGVFREKKRD